GELVEIKNAKLRGVQSFGMICAAVEVGLADLFPTEDDHAIMDITSFGAPAGTPLAKALNLDDVILEIDNKSMTNRPDLWGHYGIAREISALYDLPLKTFAPYTPDAVEAFPIEIADSDRCPRYIGVKMEGLSVMPSPFEMQTRIWRVGMRPINALVDVTNYVMLALGQPTHAFDADNISDKIIVRRAEAGEELQLLNDKKLSLSEDDLVIADSEGAVALAGVMGGVKDSIHETTEKVILEIANFESTGVRRTALRYDNRTEASSRYEKAVDPERCDLALSMTMEFFKALYPDMKVTAFADSYPNKLVKKEIDVELSWLDRRLGKRIPNEEVSKKLGLLGFEVSFTDTDMHIVVPTWRSTGDVGIKADIMEEVARMYGYENFEPTPIVTSFEGTINQLEIDLVRKIKEYLAIRCNMQEVFTYPWMSDEFVAAILQSTEGVLKLSTPPSPTESYIRSSLLPNLCRAVVKNERYFTEFAIFEEAQIFRDENYQSKYDEKEVLPTQERHVAGAFAAPSDGMKQLFLKAKGVIENMSRFTHMEGFTFKRETKPVWADETVWLNICLGDEKIGDLALLSKKASLACGIKNLATVLFEINTDALKPFKSRTNVFTHLAEYPTIEYDVSLLFDTDIKWEQIRATALKKKNNQSYLKDVAFVDEYKGAQVPEGKKSVTVRLTIGANDKTLTSGEIESCANGVVKILVKELKAEARMK
ncbi:MAG: phenylalanine--tRNA ligase subunit beta, partial [Clostridia bacterium]|nr:phenylalanine--tRNA ligase subunit beta [Clostridia bacterium]